MDINFQSTEVKKKKTHQNMLEVYVIQNCSIYLIIFIENMY